MGKLVNDLVLDAALNYIKNNAKQISVCADTPTTYGHATTQGTYMLAIKSDLTSADFTVADDTSGRKVTVAEFATIEVLASGTATHICLCDATANLLYVTTCSPQALSDGNTVTIPSWKIGIADPT